MATFHELNEKLECREYCMYNITSVSFFRLCNIAKYLNMCQATWQEINYRKYRQAGVSMYVIIGQNTEEKFSI